MITWAGVLAVLAGSFKEVSGYFTENVKAVGFLTGGMQIEGIRENK